MLYRILFVILSSSICIFCKPDWENFVDRLDLLIRRSYLIIECNDKEIQIIRIVKTFEELKSNMKCKNKENLFKHKIDNVQIIDFSHATTICENKKFMLITGHFSRVKKSLDKIENGVDWPFLHTQFTKETSKSPPIKMKFFNKDKIDIRLFRIQIDELSKKKDTIFNYLDFVNRPMVCSIRIIGLTNKTQPTSCHPMIIDQIYSPVCFYKVGGQSSPSHDELNEIIQKTDPYLENIVDNYIYITSDIKHSNSSLIQTNLISKGDKSKNTQHSNNSPIKINLINKSKEISSKPKKEEKKNPLMIIIILIIAICLSILFIGISFYYKNSSKENKDDNQLIKKESNPSNESQISILSNSDKSQQENLIFPPLKQIQNQKQQTIKRTTTNWYKLDEEI